MNRKRIIKKKIEILNKSKRGVNLTKNDVRQIPNVDNNQSNKKVIKIGKEKQPERSKQDKVIKIKRGDNKIISNKKLNKDVNLDKLNKRERSIALSVKDHVNIKAKLEKEIVFRDYGDFERLSKIDYDVVFCISSNDRYSKLDRILKQLFSQQTKYTFKVIITNDGSSDKNYDLLEYKYPDIIYIKNAVPGGKINYWRTVNNMWNKASKFKSHGIVQLDDDFILCESFVDRLLDTYYEVKEKSNNYMVFGFHIYSFDKDEPAPAWWYNEDDITIDGGMILDTQFLERINYQLDMIEHRVGKRTSSFTWVRVAERLKELGMRVYRYRNSLVWHDGNDDSKLHPTVRKIKRVYTKNWIDDGKTNYKQ